MDDSRDPIYELAEFQEVIDKVDESADSEKMHVLKTYEVLKKPLFEKRSKLLHSLKGFWLKTIMTHPQLSERFIGETEDEYLDYLLKIEMQTVENPGGGISYRINFHFKENPHFSNEVLTKQCTINRYDSDKYDMSSSKVNLKKANDEIKELGNLRKRKRSQDKTFLGWFNDNETCESSNLFRSFIEDLWQNPVEYFYSPKVEADD